MDISLNIEEIVESVRRYINEQMTEEEALKFEEMTFSNPAVAQELAFQLEMSEVLLTEYYKQFKPKPTEEETDKQSMEPANKQEESKMVLRPFYKRNIRYIAVVASVLLILGIGWQLTQNNHPSNIKPPTTIASIDTVPKQQVEIVQANTPTEKDTTVQLVKDTKKDKRIQKNQDIIILSKKQSVQDITKMQNQVLSTLGDIIALQNQVQRSLDTLAKLQKDQNIQGYASQKDTLYKFESLLYLERIEKSNRKGQIDSIQYELEPKKVELKQSINELHDRINILKGK